jgi:hypothetical protein
MGRRVSGQTITVCIHYTRSLHDLSALAIGGATKRQEYCDDDRQAVAVHESRCPSSRNASCGARADEIINHAVKVMNGLLAAPDEKRRGLDTAECIGSLEINLSTVFGGQIVGIKEVAFDAKVLPVSREQIAVFDRRALSTDAPRATSQ